MQSKSNERKLTKAEAGRIGGLKGGRLGGKISRGGGRPRIYSTDDERREARRRQALESYHRRKVSDQAADHHGCGNSL